MSWTCFFLLFALWMLVATYSLGQLLFEGWPGSLFFLSILGHFHYCWFSDRTLFFFPQLICLCAGNLSPAFTAYHALIMTASTFTFSSSFFFGCLSWLCVYSSPIFSSSLHLPVCGLAAAAAAVDAVWRLLLNIEKNDRDWTRDRKGNERLLQFC